MQQQQQIQQDWNPTDISMAPPEVTDVSVLHFDVGHFFMSQ